MCSIFDGFHGAVGVRDLNGVELLSIRRALTIWKVHKQGSLVIEGDSTNTIKWTKGLKWTSLENDYHSNRGLTSGVDVSFVHVCCTTNGVADFLAKNEINNSVSGVFCI